MNADQNGCGAVSRAPSVDKRQDHDRRAIIEAALSMIIGQDQCTERYRVACYALRHALPSAEQEVLNQLVRHGPTWDGDVCSKVARDNLLTMGLASRACNKGEQGYTVANYRGWDVNKAVA